MDDSVVSCHSRKSLGAKDLKDFPGFERASVVCLLHQENPYFTFRAFSCFLRKFSKKLEKPSPLLARVLFKPVKKAIPLQKHCSSKKYKKVHVYQQKYTQKAPLSSSIVVAVVAVAAIVIRHRPSSSSVVICRRRVIVVPSLLSIVIYCPSSLSIVIVCHCPSLVSVVVGHRHPSSVVVMSSPCVIGGRLHRVSVVIACRHASSVVIVRRRALLAVIIRHRQLSPVISRRTRRAHSHGGNLEEEG